MKPSEIIGVTRESFDDGSAISYIRLSNHAPVDQIELDGGVILDIDVNGDVVGIEVI